MMDDTNRFSPSSFAKAPEDEPAFAKRPADNAGFGDPAATTPAEPAAESTHPEASSSQAAPVEVNEAVMKFKSCRWRCDPADGEYCTHRDVLPFAGKEGFVPDSWCPDCAFYKLRRTPKKREYSGY
jgi:hypothetical protein